MNSDMKWSLRTDFKNRDPRELLTSPVDALLGVSADAAAELKQLGIQTIFDLATSPMFAFAREILFAAEGQTTGAGLYGRVSGEILDDTRRDLPFQSLAIESLESLRILGPAEAQALSGALGVANIGELAIWPPYRDALAILAEAFGDTSFTKVDPETPGDLVPGTRRYPTERVQYDILVLDAVTTSPPPEPSRMQNVSLVSASGPTRSSGAFGRSQAETSSFGEMARLDVLDAPVGSTLESAGQLDLADLALSAVGFKKPATGAILTYTQSWYTEGLSLGQLLHTIALAPGESTRIAMIDWSRRAFGTTREGIGESETLMSDLERTRSISEIVSAVATEAQQGFSKSSGWSVGGQIGHAGGGAGSADLSQMSGGGGGGSSGGGSGGVPVKLAAAHGESIGVGGGYGAAESTGWTTGQRNLSANMAQNVMDRTHQASTSSRNRWATIVREVSQSESERISTRAVTNFNHMHALSIEYFEIVQLYRVVVELSKATQCLFVPMKVLNFERPGLVTRFRATIANAGLTPRVRALREAEPDRMNLFVPKRVSAWDPDPMSQMLGEKVGERTSPSLVLPLNFFLSSITVSSSTGAQAFHSAIVEYQDGRVEEVLDPASLPDLGPYKILFPKFTPASDTTPFWDVAQIRLKKLPNQQDFSDQIEVKCEFFPMGREGFPRPQGTGRAELRFLVNITSSEQEPVLLEFTRTVTGRELFRHLAENALYYSQAIWRSLDPATTGQMLAGYTFEGQPVLSSIDPVPVAVAGNYLVFRRHLPASDQAAKDKWEAWIAAQDIKIGERQESTVPLPSGGVFAEAVLGRFNSAEKLDITRFWNWQDSPIPITAPDVAAIQAASRAQPENLVPGQLSQPVLKVEVPPNIPDPEGLKAILQAIQNGNMFRDMSGLTSTIGFAQSALSRAFDSARDAASQAGENMKTAVELYKAAFSGQGSTTSSGATRQSPAGTSRNPSETGALINQGKDMDQRGIPRGEGANGAAVGDQDAGIAGTWEGEATQATLGAGRSLETAETNVKVLGDAGTRDAGVQTDAGSADAGSAILHPWPLFSRWDENPPGDNSDHRVAFGNWVKNNYSTFDAEPCLCNHFPIRLLIEYASVNGLQIRFRYWPGTASIAIGGTREWDRNTVYFLDSHGGAFPSKEKFYKEAKSKVTAEMIGRLNTAAVVLTNVRAGDMFSIPGGSTYWHVEVIVDPGPPLVRESGTVQTLDGGVRAGRAPRTARKVGSGVPAGALDNLPRRWLYEQFAP